MRRRSVGGVMLAFRIFVRRLLLLFVLLVFLLFQLVLILR